MPTISIHAFVVVCFFLAVAWAAIGDLRAFSIPNRLVLLVAGFYPAHVLASPVPVDWISALIVGALAFFVGWFLFARGFIGGGDVKLIAAVALWAGPQMIAPFVLLVLASGGVLAAVILLHAKVNLSNEGGLTRALAAPIPYGIAIAIGSAFVAGRLLMA